MMLPVVKNDDISSRQVDTKTAYKDEGHKSDDEYVPTMNVWLFPKNEGGSKGNHTAKSNRGGSTPHQSLCIPALVLSKKRNFSLPGLLYSSIMGWRISWSV